MKKGLLAVLFIIGFSTISFAQFFENDSIFSNKLVVSTGDQDFEVHLKLVDDYKKTNASYTWRREVVNIEGSWTTAICDPFLCHGTATDSADFTSDTARNDDMIVHFYMPDSSGGKGSVRIIIKNSGTNLEDTAIFSINVWNRRLKVETLNTTKVAVYPNPTNDKINVSSNQGIKQVEIASLDGKVLRTVAFDGAQDVTIDISSLPNGLYLVKVKNTGNSVKTTKVSKTN